MGSPFDLEPSRSMPHSDWYMRSPSSEIGRAAGWLPRAGAIASWPVQVEIGSRRFNYVKLPSAKIRTHISAVAQANDSTIPSETIASGQFRFSRCHMRGRESAVMTPHRLFFCLSMRPSRRFKLRAGTCGSSSTSSALVPRLAAIALRRSVRCWSSQSSAKRRHTRALSPEINRQNHGDLPAQATPMLRHSIVLAMRLSSFRR